MTDRQAARNLSAIRSLWPMRHHSPDAHDALRDLIRIAQAAEGGRCGDCVHAASPEHARLIDCPECPEIDRD